MDADAQAKPVEQRHGGQHFVAGAEHGIGRHHLLAQGVEILIGQDDALGGAGGAAGIEDDRRVIGTALYLIVIEAVFAHTHKVGPADDRGIVGNLFDFPALGQHVTGPNGGGEGVFDAGNHNIDHFGILPDPFKLMIELVQGDGGDAFRFIEIEFDFLFRRQGVNHIGDAAHQIDGVEQVDGLGAVGHGDGDPVIFPDADGPQGLGAELNLLHQLFIGGGFAHEVERHVVGVFLGRFGYGVIHGAFKILQMHGHVAHVVLPGRFYRDGFHLILHLLAQRQLQQPRIFQECF